MGGTRDKDKMCIHFKIILYIHTELPRPEEDVGMRIGKYRLGR